MRILAMGSVLARALVLLHHLLMFGLLLGPLFRGQQRQGFPSGLDRQDAEPDLHVGALLELGFDGGQVRTSRRRSVPSLPVRRPGYRLPS